MPRLSTKRKLLLELEKNLLTRRTDATICFLLLDSSSEESGRENNGSDYETRSTDDSTGTIEEIINFGLENAIERISSQRYAFPRKPYRKGYSKAVFDRDLQEDDNDGTPPWLTDEDFLQKYRMSRESFKQLLDLIKDYNVFKHVEGWKGRHQAPAAYQLLAGLQKHHLFGISFYHHTSFVNQISNNCSNLFLVDPFVILSSPFIGIITRC